MFTCTRTDCQPSFRELCPFQLIGHFQPVGSGTFPPANLEADASAHPADDNQLSLRRRLCESFAKFLPGESVGGKHHAGFRSRLSPSAPQRHEAELQAPPQRDNTRQYPRLLSDIAPAVVIDAGFVAKR